MVPLELQVLKVMMVVKENQAQPVLQVHKVVKELQEQQH
jgi:hypothetical protein